MRGVLIDLDGVIYEGDEPVAGAADAVAWLVEEGIAHLFLTNTTSRPRSALIEKLAGLGVDTTPDRILTPPVAAARWLETHAPGPAALFVPERPSSATSPASLPTQNRVRPAWCWAISVPPGTSPRSIGPSGSSWRSPVRRSWPWA
jgi:hypothetical protein